MNPDVFITIAFCVEAALFAIAGGLFVRHEWRREALEACADQRALSRLSRSRRLGHRREGADDVGGSVVRLIGGD
jgi:hypothetical protein